MRRGLMLLAAVLCAEPALAVVIPTIDGGIWNLQPNTVEVIQILGQGEDLQGLNLYLQVQDGGPLITSMDVIGAGMLFHDNNLDQSVFSANPRTWGAQTVTAAGSVTASTMVPLGSVTLDTTGIAPGVYQLKLEGVDVPGFPEPFVSDFAGTPAVVINGSVTISPEPSTLVSLAALLLSGGVIWVWRRRRPA